MGSRACLNFELLDSFSLAGDLCVHGMPSRKWHREALEEGPGEFWRPRSSNTSLQHHPTAAGFSMFIEATSCNDWVIKWQAKPQTRGKLADQKLQEIIGSTVFCSTQKQTKPSYAFFTNFASKTVDWARSLAWKELPHLFLSFACTTWRLELDLKRHLCQNALGNCLCRVPGLR